MVRVIFLSFLFAISGCTSTPKKKTPLNHSPNKVITEKTEIKDSTLLDTNISVTNILNQFSEIEDTTVSISKITNQNLTKKKQTSKKNFIIENIKKNDSLIIKSTTPDHSIWNRITKKYVSTSGKVNYPGFISDINALNTYLAHLENVTPQKNWTKKERLAYWFNLYNAATIHLIASSYPVKSIKDINGGKPWDKKFIRSGSAIFSLNDIENTIVRSNFKEPRLHVAFNCAAISCPKLLNAAFLPATLDIQLETLSKSWIQNLSKNRIAENELQVSKIFEWYGEDFKEGIIPFISTYTKIKIHPEAIITFLPYDWNLNE